MASLAKEKGKYYRIHWKFAVSAGPQAGKTIEGSLYLGRCTRAAARTQLRKVEAWEEAVKTGRHLPEGQWKEVYKLWLREKELSYAPQSLDRAQRVVSLYVLGRDRGWHRGSVCLR